MFKDDLHRGQMVEQEFLDRLLPAFRDAYRIFGKDSRADIVVPELNILIEVKYDPASSDTGNIVIEYYHNKPSALTVTAADYWLISTGDEELWVTPKGLYELIIELGLDPVRIHGPGDTHAKWVFLIPISHIRRVSA